VLEGITGLLLDHNHYGHSVYYVLDTTEKPLGNRVHGQVLELLRWRSVNSCFNTKSLILVWWRFWDSNIHPGKCRSHESHDLGGIWLQKNLVSSRFGLVVYYYCQLRKPWHPRPDFNVFFAPFKNPLFEWLWLEVHVWQGICLSKGLKLKRLWQSSRYLPASWTSGSSLSNRLLYSKSTMLKLIYRYLCSDCMHVLQLL